MKFGIPGFRISAAVCVLKSSPESFVVGGKRIQDSK
jgi:hypothetical protein